MELAMKVSDLTESERKVWQSATTGALVDLRVGNPELDSPEKWTEWESGRTIQAEVIVDLLIGDDEAASTAVRGVRLQGARITGELNLEATTLRCPLALLDCSFASGINLSEATAVSVRLSGSHVPTLDARQLRTHGDLRLDEGFSVSGGAELAGAHIGGQLNCTGGQFSNADGPALSADGLTVDSSMFCNEGFSASGEVRLAAAQIGDVLEGILDLTAAKTSSYHDDTTSWPEYLRLDGFVYHTIEGASVKERLEWLLRNESGYLPQIYEQLAAFYRRSGHDENARRVLIAKQRQRSAEGTLADKIWGSLLDWTVGFGYRTWLALVWLAGLLVLGTILFGGIW